MVSLAVTFSLACSGGPQPETTGSGGGAGNSNVEPFEGAISMKFDSGAPGGVMSYYIKGDRMRMEMTNEQNPAMQVVVIGEMGSGKMTTLMPQQKMYMTMDMKGMADEMKDDVGEAAEDREKMFGKLTETGREETIAGHKCQHWLMGENQEVDICVAKGLGYFGMQGGGSGRLKDLIFSPEALKQKDVPPEWNKFLEGGAFPLKMTVKENGNEMTMEATKIERKKIEDSMFTIPPDYKEFSLPGRK
jgi:hypothetical protein